MKKKYYLIPLPLIGQRRFTFIECSDNKKLKTFYENNGFKQFSERKIKANDKYYNSNEYLVQMMIDLRNY